MRRASPTTAILIVAGLLGGLIACDGGDDRVRTTFTVNGMHCDACSASIVSTLEKVEGVDGAMADHEMGMAEAIYRPHEVEADVLKAEIEKLGYTVTGMETEIIEG